MNTVQASRPLAARFGHNTFVIRSETPLNEDQMRRAAPSIFAEGKHGSRSERYTYIPTIEVLRGLRHEGFEPFMVAQGESRIEGKTEFTKHMIRMRHACQVTSRPEANEIILINSHDGASSYQMLAGVVRVVCCNGLVVPNRNRRPGCSPHAHCIFGKLVLKVPSKVPSIFQLPLGL
jgi:hypothetical protein